MARAPKNWKLIKNFNNLDDFVVFTTDQIPKTVIRDSHNRTKFKNNVIQNHKTRIEKRQCKNKQVQVVLNVQILP